MFYFKLPNEVSNWFKEGQFIEPWALYCCSIISLVAKNLLAAVRIAPATKPPGSTYCPGPHIAYLMHPIIRTICIRVQPHWRDSRQESYNTSWNGLLIPATGCQFTVVIYLFCNESADRHEAELAVIIVHAFCFVLPDRVRFVGLWLMMRHV